MLTDSKKAPISDPNSIVPVAGLDNKETCVESSECVPECSSDAESNFSDLGTPHLSRICDFSPSMTDLSEAVEKKLNDNDDSKRCSEAIEQLLLEASRLDIDDADF